MWYAASVRKVVLAVSAASLVVAGIALMNQVRGGPPKPREVAQPLTDVAAKAPAIDVDPSEAPERRLARLAPSSQAVRPAVPPAEMPDPARPPQWTKTLAAPGPPQPPDPFVPPPIAVDPDRGRPPAP